MYYYIKGRIVHKDESGVAVEANGVAYYMNTTLTSMAAAGGVGDETTLYTYLNVREDAMELYGFASQEEKRMFLMLLSVSGVGPKAALSILSVLTPEKFALAVVTDDVKSITQAAGVGPKLAKRLILELRDKLKGDELNVATDAGEAAAEVLTDSRAEAVSALVALGYSAADARNAVRKVDADLSVEEIIKKALVSF